MDCRVVVEAAVPVYDVATADEAVRIAISKTGDMLNPDLNYVEINVGTRRSPSGEELEPAFIVADEALVALELEMTVFNVERDEHAARIARKEIGQRMRNIPLDVLDVSVFADEDDEDDERNRNDGTNGTDESANTTTVPRDAATDAGSDSHNASESENGNANGNANANGNGNETTGGSERTGDLLPEFEDLLDE